MTQCPLCSETRFSAARFGLVRCIACGLVVNPAIFHPGEAERVNAQAFGETYQAHQSYWSQWFEALKNRRYLADLRRAGVFSGSLLEVGIGTGAFLRSAQAAGFEVQGCDLSEPLCRRVNASTGIPVHNIGLERLPAAAWDVVVMHHVLEHVADPVAFLRAAGQRLKPGGLLHLAVPNADCWQALLPGWNSYEPYHMAYFNEKTLLRAVEAAGLRPIRIWTVDPFSVWFLTILRTALGWRHRRVTPAQPITEHGRLIEHTYRLLMAAVGGCTLPLRWIQGRLGRGDELLMLAQR